MDVTIVTAWIEAKRLAAAKGLRLVLNADHHQFELWAQDNLRAIGWKIEHMVQMIITAHPITHAEQQGETDDYVQRKDEDRASGPTDGEREPPAGGGTREG